MKLVSPSDINEKEFNEFIAEFISAKEPFVPYSLNQNGKTFQEYVVSLNDESIGKGIPEGWVPATTCFLVNEEGKIYGAVNIRHRLTDNLKIEGGHIGYGIRPSVRNRNHGTTILKLGLEILRKMGILKVLVTCDRENINSARVIQKNGGKLDSEIEKDRKIFQRYWIEL